MADAVTAPFVMHGARAAIAGGLFHIETQVGAIELAVNDNPSLAFDLAKTLIESVCRTILAERSVTCEPNDDLPKLFKTTSNTLPFLPVSESAKTDVRRSLAQTLGGLHTAVQGVCELRNKCGFASHGSDSERPALETIQAILAAETADAIVGFLYRVHRQDRPQSTHSLPEYEGAPDFNQYIDELHEKVRIFEEEFIPSKILFELARTPYLLYMGEFKSESQTSSVDGAPESTKADERKP
jgi:abortive infection Abi-like protein